MEITDFLPLEIDVQGLLAIFQFKHGFKASLEAFVLFSVKV